MVVTVGSSNSCISSLLTPPLENQGLLLLVKKSKSACTLMFSKTCCKMGKISCSLSESEIGETPTSNKVSFKFRSKVEEYNTAMKKMMSNPYEYHHELGMNYTLITDNLIVGSQPQKPEDIDHLKQEENVAYILNLQQDKDVQYWGINLQSIITRCQELGIRHMRRPARDFDPESLRNGLPKAVSSLEWAISEGKGKVYVHCTAGLGRAPAVAIAYMYWFCKMNLNRAYNELISKRTCGPNKNAIRGATYDLAKNDPLKVPFESLPEYAFEDIADRERKLIQDHIHSLRGT
ncbi:DSPc domain-containing protein [Cephalotus follicularis]|uniref:DSPc domain-containing protein n=1 Tax=Cephalotus follicularis TaxID=3775 RepID=A0A1Q3B3X4_CEPFO|nr:DSPc domain-containing protein [Cephalotus follicularis]